MRLSRILVVAVAFVALAGFLSHLPGRHPRKAPPVVVLALDGATWDVLDPLMARGLLPNLTALRDGGAWGVLHSFPPLTSPVVWTTIATGKVPEKHGITYFVRFPRGPVGGAVPVTRNLRHTKAIWNILSDRGLDVAVVGWFVTWPAEEVNGVMISDRAQHPKLARRTFPPRSLAGLEPVEPAEAVRAMPRFMQFAYDASKTRPSSLDPEEQFNFLISDRFIGAYTRDAFYLGAAQTVLERHPHPDFFALYLRGTDDVQHGFWKFMDPAPFGDVPPDQVARFGHVIERFWQWTDEAVGEVLSHFGDDTLVLVLSDHGFGPAVGPYAVFNQAQQHLSGAHREEGLLIAHGPGIRRGERVDGATTLDVVPTLLYYLGLPVAKDMDGHVVLGLFDESFARRAPREIASYEDSKAPGEDEVIKSGADKSILEHLRSLGYIE